MSLMLYRVLAASGGFVNGLEVAIGSDIAMTREEAAYEVDVGNVAPTNKLPPSPPLPPALLEGDLIQTSRGSYARPVVIASLEAFLTRSQGPLAAYFEARGDEVAVDAAKRAQAVTDALRGVLLGNADADHDTLGKLAALQAALSVSLDTKASQADLDQIGRLVGISSLGALDLTGGRDMLARFRDAPIGPRYSIPPGTYQLSGDLYDFSRKFVFPEPGVRFVGAGRLYADIKRPYLADVARITLGEIVQMLAAGLPVTFDCFGDSLMWGLLGDYVLTNIAQDNGYIGAATAAGSIPYRSSLTIPQAFEAGLRSAHRNNPVSGTNAVVRNCGYPGDKAYDSLRRWRDRPFSTVSLIMLGSNDGVDNRPGVQTRYAMRELIETRLDLGSFVILLLPPEWPDAAINARIQVARSIAVELAEEYDLLCVDMRDQLQPLGSKQWVGPTDGHLSKDGYELGGWDLAAIFAPTAGAAPLRFGPGRRIAGGDFPVAGSGANISRITSLISRDQSLVSIAPTFRATMGIYVESDCVPYLEIVNETPGTARHMAYIRVNKTELTAEFTNVPLDGVYRRAFTPRLLHRGYRMVQLEGVGAAAAYFDALTGQDPALHVQTADGAYRRSSLSETRRPVVFSGSGAWFAREGILTPWAHHFEGHLTLHPNGGNGLSVMGGVDTVLPYGSAVQIIILRDGASLVLRDLTGGRPDSVIANVFPATGNWSGSIHVEITHPSPASANINVYVDGDYKGSRAGPLSCSGGYVGLVSLVPGLFVCDQLYVMNG